MPSATVNGVSLFYRQLGSGPDVVMVHGLAADHGYWYVRSAPQLSGEHRVTMYDLRGHGLSATPQRGYTTADMGVDLAALLECLEIESAHVVGHSFGGAVALQLARSAPSQVASLTIADAPLLGVFPAVAAKDSPEWSAWEPRLRELGVEIDSEDPLDYRVISRMLRAAGGGERHERWQLGRRQLERWNALLANTTAAEDFGQAAGLARAAIGKVAQPALLVYGGLSFSLPAGRQLAELLPDARLEIVPDAGHFFPVTRPTALTDRIRAFLRTLEDPR